VLPGDRDAAGPHTALTASKSAPMFAGGMPGKMASWLGEKTSPVLTPRDCRALVRGGGA